MLQKHNDFKIIENLRKKNLHLREIARKLNLIPSTVMRNLQKLQNENIIDYRKEGKNNVYFLKKTIEAQTFLLMTENYKFLEILKEPKIRLIAKKLKEKTKGELIILFGSYAKGTQTRDSDIDIYIETKKKDVKKELEKISEKISIKIGKLDKDNLLTKEIIKNHIIIQNQERFYQIIK